MARRSRQDAEMTRQLLLDTAMGVFSRKGYGSTSLDEVAAECGLTRGAVYGHFGSKAGLYEQIIRLCQDPVYELLEEAASDTGPALLTLRRFMRRWLTLMVTNPRYRDSFEMLMNKTEFTDELAGVAERERRLTRDAVGVLEEVFRRGVLEGDLPGEPGGIEPALAGLHTYAYLMGLSQTWLFNPRSFSVRRQSEALIDLFLKGLAQQGSRALTLDEADLTEEVAA